METPVPIAFTDRELDVMSVLWDAGSATVAEVRERLSDDLAYTTVLTVLRTLDVALLVEGAQHGEDGRVREVVDDLAYTTVVTLLLTLDQKGDVAHIGQRRAHRYRPLVKRAAAGRSALRRLVEKVFDGSPELLLTQLVSDKNLSDEELRRLRKLLAERLREKKP